MERARHTLPSRLAAQRFAVETLHWDAPVGSHDIDRWRLDYRQVVAILSSAAFLDGQVRMCGEGDDRCEEQHGRDRTQAEGYWHSMRENGFTIPRECKPMADAYKPPADDAAVEKPEL
jgi:hypothetical protein